MLGNKSNIELPPLEFVGHNEMWQPAQQYDITVFTPVYNRQATLPRLIKSLNAQSREGLTFEWIAIDDGSADNSLETLKGAIDEVNFPMRVYHQVNSGNHVAWNRMLELAQGELVMLLDSDDTYVDNALQTVINRWRELPPEKQSSIKGIAFTCLDPDTGKLHGSKPTDRIMETSDLEYRFKLKYDGENCGASRLAVLREMPFPIFEPGLHFIPESIVWYSMARKYNMIFYPEHIRLYFQDAPNQLTGVNTNRARSNFYLWQFYINSLDDYIRYAPKLMLKGYVGYCRDGLITGRSVAQLLKGVNRWYKKLGVLAALLPGYALKVLAGKR